MAAAPVWKFYPALAHNLILLIFLFLNGFVVRNFLRKRGVGPVPALLGGLLAQTIPFISHERGVLQLQPFFGAVLAIDLLWRLAEKPRLRYGLGWGIAAGITFLTSEYYWILLMIFVLPAFLFLYREFKSRSAIVSLLAGMTLSAMLILPVAIPQERILAGMNFRRASSTIEKFSASPSDYLRRSPALLFKGSKESSELKGNFLWPGFILTGLAVVGAFQRRSASVNRSLVGYLLAVGGLAFLLSLGPKLTLGGWQPYELLRSLPGMENFRSPFRIAIFVQISMVVLAGIALQTILTRRRPGLAIFLVILALLENFPAPASLTPVPPSAAKSELESPAVFIPFAKGTTSGAYLQTVTAMVSFQTPEFTS